MAYPGGRGGTRVARPGLKRYPVAYPGRRVRTRLAILGGLTEPSRIETGIRTRDLTGHEGEAAAGRIAEVGGSASVEVHRS